MKLYFATGTCSMASLMEIKELGIACELVEVSWKQKKNVDLLDQLNPLGSVPVLVTDEKQVITQNVAILEFLGDRYSKGAHIPEAGSVERAQVTRWLSFVASDFHKAFDPIFRLKDMASTEEAQNQIEAFAKKNVLQYVEYIDRSLKNQNYICGSKFTVADCYLFTILRWCEWVEIDLKDFKEISNYMGTMSARPGIKQVLEIEGS